MAAPVISRNFAIFLISIVSLVLAAPFVNRDDWLGWAAGFVGTVAVVAILGLLLSAIVCNVKEIARR